MLKEAVPIEVSVRPIEPQGKLIGLAIQSAYNVFQSPQKQQNEATYIHYTLIRALFCETTML